MQSGQLPMRILFPSLGEPRKEIENISITRTASDPELHSTVKDNGYAALARTLEVRHAQLVRLALRITRCPEDAEDVVQQSVVNALTHLSRFRGESRMDTWLHAIVLNTARTWLRNRRAHVHVSLESPGYNDHDVVKLDFPHPGKNPEEHCWDHELHRLLLAEVGYLDPIYKRPIQIRDLDEYSYCETAEMLKLNISTLKARIFRGRTLLKRRLCQPAPRRRQTSSMAERTKSKRKKEVGGDR
jgi:RNA polymerase sigma-70 factor (ECF subfamily)